jgi:hypothetical protein
MFCDRIVYATGWEELYPICDHSDESCWSQNSRAVLRAMVEFLKNSVRILQKHGKFGGTTPTTSWL